MSDRAKKYGDVALAKVKEFSAKNSADSNPAASCH